MKKRFTFQCWNCQRTYTLFREITQGQEVIVACPYCHKEAVVDLSPYPKKKVIVAVRGEGDTEREIEELVLPDVLPTQKKSADE
jgi:hypothetical protein